MCSLGQDWVPYFMRVTEKATGPMCHESWEQRTFPQNKCDGTW